MGNVLLLAVVAIMVGVIVTVLIWSIRTKPPAQRVAVTRRSGAGAAGDDYASTTPTGPTVMPAQTGDDTNLNPGGGSFGGGGADAGWTDSAPNASESNTADSGGSFESGGSDSSSSSDNGGSSDSGGGASDS